ncbi:MAG: hypothetical protein JOZ86_08540 [Candidatus Eremiobacteraeota bacterium]|nr:hypothetical protein [Candidatus Eremiobacteraeota bacterium]
MRIVVPRGAEARAVRRAVPSAIEVLPGAASAASLPAALRQAQDDRGPRHPELVEGPPENIVAVGLCGALRGPRAGAMVIYAHVVDEKHDTMLDPALVRALAAALPGAAIVRACTTDHVVTTVAERTALAARFDADVVDMEGTHLAAALAARGVRYAMVRVVSDDATRDLPPIDDAIGPNGNLRPLQLTWAMLRTPVAAVAFIRDVQSVLRTLGETAKTLAAIEDRT